MQVFAGCVCVSVCVFLSTVHIINKFLDTSWGAIFPLTGPLLSKLCNQTVGWHSAARHSKLFITSNEQRSKWNCNNNLMQIQ